MKQRAFFGLLALAGLGLLLQAGCNITYVVRNQEPGTVAYNPYPNATHIQNRINEQLNRIRNAQQQGVLPEDSAFVLSQNDELIGRYAQEDRAQVNQTADLNYDQTNALDNMLNDNAAMIRDATQNRQAYGQYYTGGSFDYASSGNSYMYMSYLDYQVQSQTKQVDSGLRSNQLTASQAAELRTRIQAIQDAKKNYYRGNRRLDLSEEQVRQLSQMTQDNGRYINFRLKGSRGTWDRQNFNNLKTQHPQGLGLQQGAHWGNPNWHPPVNTAATPVPVIKPMMIPTVAPEPTHVSPFQNVNGWNVRPTLAPTAAPAVAVPAAPAPVPVPVVPVGLAGLIGRGGNNHPVQAAPTQAPTQAPVPAPAPTQVPTAVPTQAPTIAPTLAPAVPTQVPATVAPTALPTALPTPALRLLPPGQVMQFLKHADQSAQGASGLSDDETKELNGKLAALHQQANAFMNQNHARSVTADQMNQLNGMVAEMDQFIQNAQADNAPQDNGANPGRGQGRGRNKEQ